MMVSNRFFDAKDQKYRSAPNLDSLPGKEGYTLNASYNLSNHTYTFWYRGHMLTIQESLIIWDTYPMNILAEKAASFLKDIDKKIGWNWEPSNEKLGHDEILSKLEKSRREGE